jgi:hypothetical protein
MTGNQIGSAIYLGLCLVLVASSLALRRLPRGKTLSLAAIWGAIVLGAWALVMALQRGL